METNSWIRRGAGKHLSRRDFLKTAIAGGCAAPYIYRNLRAAQLPAPDASGIEHIIVVMMENRSFDHFLGWLPGADGKQAGLSYPDRAGAMQSTHPLAPDYQGCDHPDPDHSYQGGRIEFNNGACDGWLKAGSNDAYAIGYYTQQDLPFFAQAATNWTFFDRYFCSILGPTYPNRIYQHAAQTDRIENTFAISQLPTIWDRLAAKGVTGRYYFSDLPFLALWGAKHLNITRHIAQFYAECATGTLPAVSFVDPRFFGASYGLSRDDHPHADIRNGQAFLNRVYNAVRQSPKWKQTLLFINYDEWGGFFDHVPPTAGPIPSADQAAGNTDGLRGFRVPALLVSRFAPRGTVAHGVYDHTSVLKLIEWRFGLEPLSARDQAAANLAEALDFSAPDTAAPEFNVPAGPFGEACSQNLTIGFDRGATNQAPQLVLEWIKGKTLEVATNAAGPWSLVTNSTAPYRISPSAPAQFFRVQNKWLALARLALEHGFDLSQGEG